MASKIREQEKYEFLFKYIIIGDTGTGKSCILHQFLEGKFSRSNKHTIGVEFGAKIVDCSGKKIKLQIWDTAGQERFRSVTRSYYRGAAAALLVYDVTNRETFTHVTNWLTDAKSLAGDNIVIILVGNKKDLSDQREVTLMEATKFSSDHGLLFFETSAMSGENVEEAFLRCSKSILGRVEAGLLDPHGVTSGVQLGNLPTTRQPTPDEPSSCAC